MTFGEADAVLEGVCGEVADSLAPVVGAVRIHVKVRRDQFLQPDGAEPPNDVFPVRVAVHPQEGRAYYVDAFLHGQLLGDRKALAALLASMARQGPRS